VQAGVEVEVELDDPNQGPDLEVVVVEGFVLVGEDYHLASHVEVEDHVGSRALQKSQVVVGVGVAMHCAHAGQLLFAFLAPAPSSVVVFDDQPTWEAFSRELALISEALALLWHFA
jgi:hypothetical protein